MTSARCECLHDASVYLQDGRLPLHYAAAQRETLPLYTALINAGQDALAVDSREKTSEVIEIFTIETYFDHDVEYLVLHGAWGGDSDAGPGEKVFTVEMYFKGL